MTALFTLACGSKLETKYTDEGIAAADGLCACLDTADGDSFTACWGPAKAKLSAAEKVLIDRGYFDDHNDAAPMKAFKERAEFCRKRTGDAAVDIGRRALAPKPIDPAALARAAKEVEALELAAKQPAAKAAAKPTARRATPAKKTAAPAKSSATKDGVPATNAHGPLWAK